MEQVKNKALNKIQRSKLRTVYEFLEERHSLNLPTDIVDDIIDRIKGSVYNSIEIGILEDYLKWLDFKEMIEDDLIFYYYLPLNESNTIKISIRCNTVNIQIRGSNFTEDFFKNCESSVESEVMVNLNAKNWQKDFVEILQKLIQEI